MSHLVPISDELYAKVTAFAKQKGEPLEMVVESLVAQGVQLQPTDDIFADDPIAEFIGAFDSGDLPPLEPHEHDVYFAMA